LSTAIRVQRNRVIWLGKPPAEQDIFEFERRKLSFHPSSLEKVHEVFNSSRAIIVPFEDKISTPRDVRHIFSDALNYGLMVAIIIPKDKHDEYYSTLASIVKMGHGRIKIVMSFDNAIQEVSEYNPGPSANHGLKIEGTEIPELILLLKRAFWNCESITLIPLTGGSTAEAVFRADVIQSGIAGPAPLPFFVKFDRIDRIRCENDKYADYVEGYIPFNHRPNLIRERCIEGAIRALLVGNFVEHSESLEALAHRGTFTPAIYSLFHQAFRNWHGQATRGGNIQYAEHKELSMKESLQPKHEGWGLFPNSSTEPAVLEEARILGCEHNPQALMKRIEAWPKILHYRGPIHRDLRTQNVQVRGSDAIVIDFYNTGLGPLLWDPATLEISLSFLLMARIHNERGTKEQWCEFMLRLYQRDITRPLDIVECPSSLEGIWSCIRETRFYALGLEIEPGTYRQALGIRLLHQSFRKLSGQLPADWEIYKRALSYKLAEQIITTVGGNLQ
jgi:hypothetical protein